MVTMTTPQQSNPTFTPIDMGNHLLGPGPAVLTTSMVPTTDGQRLALTIRTTSTTLTVLLDKNDVTAWLNQLQRDAARMGGSTLVTASGPLVA